MNSGKETTNYRYLVVEEGSILFCTDSKSQLETFLQSVPANKVAVYQKRYGSESLLCEVEYEDDNEEGKSDV